MIEAMGGKCVLCSYSKCHGSLVFHHLVPEEKELSFSKLRANPRTWDVIVAELRKCVMLCANCHGEVHDGSTEVPEDATRFDESFACVKTLDTLKTRPCPVCAEPMRPNNQTCSLSCAGFRKQRVDWSKHDVSELQKTMTYQQIADMLGVSLACVSKHAKKMREKR